MPNPRRKSGNMSKPMGGSIGNAVNQRVDSQTTPKAIKNQVKPASMAKYCPCGNAVSGC